MPVTADDPRVLYKRAYMHTRCLVVKGQCEQCGKNVYNTDARKGDGAGRYWHSECTSAPLAETLGTCSKCKKWITKREGGVKIGKELFHTACAPS